MDKTSTSPPDRVLGSGLSFMGLLQADLANSAGKTSKPASPTS